MEEEFKNRLSKYIKEDTGYLEELKVANIFSKAGGVSDIVITI